MTAILEAIPQIPQTETLTPDLTLEDVLGFEPDNLLTPAPDYPTLQWMQQHVGQFHASGPAHFRTANTSTAPDVYVRSYFLSDGSEGREVIRKEEYTTYRKIADPEQWILTPDRYEHLADVARRGTTALDTDEYNSLWAAWENSNLDVEERVAMINSMPENARARLRLHDSIQIARLEAQVDRPDVSRRLFEALNAFDQTVVLPVVKAPEQRSAPQQAATTSIASVERQERPEHHTSHRKPSLMARAIGRAAMLVGKVVPVAYSQNGKHK